MGEVLSADASQPSRKLAWTTRTRFVPREHGPHTLSLGGSRTPAEVFAAFRGRPASSEALIRHSGLVAAA